MNEIATIAQLMVNIGANIGDFKQGTGEVKRDLKSLVSDVAIISAKAMAGVAAVMAPVSAYALKLSSNMQQAKISMETMLGSAEKADAMIADLWKFAAETPFEFAELQTASKRMLAFGFAAEDIIPSLTAIGDAAAGLGVGADGVNRITLALGQMKAKGKVSGDEMLQMTEAGIPAWDILSKSIGKSTGEVMKLAEKGVIPADQAIQALLVGMEERFPGMMDKQSKSMQGLFSTLKDNISTVLIEVFKPAVAWLTDVGLPKLIEMTGKFAETIKSGGSITDAINSMFSGGFDGVLSQMGIVGEYLQKIGNAIAWVKDNANLLVPILIELAAAFIALQIIQSVLGPLEAFVVVGIVVVGIISAIAAAAGNMAAVAAIAPIFAGLIAVLSGLATASLVIAGVILAIGVLAAATYLIYNNWDALKTWFIKLWNDIVNFVSDNILILCALFPALGIAAYVIYEYWGDAVAIANKVITWLAEQVAWITDKIINNFQWYAKMWDDFVAWAKQGVSDFKVYLSDLVDSFIPQWASSMLSGVQSLGQKLAAKTSEIGKAMRNNLTIDVPSTATAVNGIADFRRSEDSNTISTTAKNAVGIKPADWSGVDFTGGDDKKGASEAGQIVKAEADYEIDIAKNKAKLLLDLIKSEQEDMDRERKNGLSGIRQYWALREQEDTTGLSSIKKYWDKRNELDIKGINAELDTLNLQKSALETEMSATSDPSDTIKLKKEMLDLTTSITLKERELGQVVKKNAELANNESVGFIEKYASLLHDIKKTMSDLNNTNITAGLTGSAKEDADIENEKKSRLKAVQDVVDGWEKATAEMKDSYKEATIGNVDMEKWKNQQIEMINKQSEDKRNQYHATAKGIQADIDAAYTANSMADLQKTLTAENAIRLNNYNAQQSMMDTYQQAYLQAHATTAGLVSDLYATSLDGLGTAFSDILMDVNNIGSAFDTLGKTMAKVVTDYVGKWLAGRLMMAIFGKTTAATEAATSMAAGVATAAAWAPAAAMVSLATFGANSAPAMAGIAATTALSAGLAIAGLAAGGAVSGPGTGTSDSILTWLSNGEYVIKADAVKSLGLGALNTLNTGKMPAYATGGLVTGSSLSSVSRYDAVSSTSASQGNYEKSDNAGAGTINSLNLNIHALDGKSVEKWLKTGGGQKIQKYFGNQVSSFAVSGVTI